MKSFLLTLLLFAGGGRGRLGRSLMDVPMERMFLDLQMPVSESLVVLGAVGMPARPKGMRELALERGQGQGRLLFSAGVQFYFQ